MATSVNAHITGTVWKIEVKVGDTVTEGQTVVILESMKMEMPVESPADGKVTAILIKEGQPVEEGAPLVELGRAEPRRPTAVSYRGAGPQVGGFGSWLRSPSSGLGSGFESGLLSLGGGSPATGGRCAGGGPRSSPTLTAS